MPDAPVHQPERHRGAFVFLVPVALFLAPSALAGGDFAGFVTNFAFYAVFSAILSTALAGSCLPPPA